MQDGLVNIVFIDEMYVFLLDVCFVQVEELYVVFEVFLNDICVGGLKFLIFCMCFMGNCRCCMGVG